MRQVMADGLASVRTARLRGAAAALLRASVSAFALAILPALPAHAQQIALPSDLSGDGQMLLEADTLTYDNDNQTVIAEGSVKIDYNGYKLVARRVSYNQKTGRLVASGGVEILDKQGTKINSEEIDITDDFADGFINALRVETAEKVHFGAESAERKDGYLTTFNNGVYTACEPCEDDPDKAPAWRIKARRIIWNGQAKTVRFEKASFELFGMPIATLPYFEIADPTVKRKTGFLLPGIRYGSSLGYGAAVPFFIAVSPTQDLTLTTTGYTKQGFLAEAEWRQMFNSGSYTLKMAGIIQQNPGAFAATSVDSTVRNRGMIGTTGKFRINPRWTFGWDVLVQSDKDFARTYSLAGFNQYNRRNEVYLTGLNDKNYFDLRFMKFAVQETLPDSHASARNPRQPWVLPSFDYSRVADQPIAGGQLSLDVNARVTKRSVSEVYVDADPSFSTLRGVDGETGRLTAELEWKRTLITQGGLVVTPLLALRGDTSFQSATASATMLGFDPAAEVRAAWYRGMATAGLDVRWPILFSTTSASHVLEPVAQIFARPSEMGAASHGLANEDAQSLVFDATSLFERDKFSGYDRMEGGVRANLGIRYSGTFANGWHATALFGQSYHLAGVNSFASADLVNAGQFSGLETNVSDFVGMAAIGNSAGFSASLKGRFDEKTFEMRRFEAAAALTKPRGSFSARYAFIQAQPRYGFLVDRQEVAAAGTVKLNDRWTVFGNGTYDLVSKTLVRDSIGISYANFGKETWCIGYSLTLAETRPVTAPHTPTRNIGFNISLRTLGDFGSSTSAAAGFN
ncbi:MAG: LPS-assembly protein LptD [Rhizobiaceae bacterium]